MGRNVKIISKGSLLGRDILILVTLGTQNVDFTRLLKEIDKLINQKIINDKVIVQSGYTNYKSNNFEIIPLLTFEELNEYLKKADLIITHGGVGSILDGIKNNKKVIAVPRLKKYNEASNDHQIQIVNAFAKRKYILECEKINELKQKIKDSKNFTPEKYKSNNKYFINNLKNYIDKC